ncbi:MAG: 3-phosphoshikimate 1-carboxyvinyltransferase, partial [Vicinamibacterales bacterium]
MNDEMGSTTIVEPAKTLRGVLRVPGDKSISHRYAMLAALANGTTTIKNYSMGADCQSTLSCLQALGVSIESTSGLQDTGITISITGQGLGSLTSPKHPIDTGNSGTTMRLLAGILANHPFTSVLTGDSSLQKRPMGRIIQPLQQMGATLESTDGCPPLVVRGAQLTGINYAPSVASAQVKSSVLLAGLHADGTTQVSEPIATRDHTERALSAFGALTRNTNGVFSVTGGSPLRPLDLTIPGDPSSAAFWIIAASIIPNSDIVVEGVGLNPTRTAYIDILRSAGADIQTELDGTEASEPYGSIRVRSRPLDDLSITAEQVPSVIDELPALGALAAHGSVVEVSGASELRHKE